VQVRLDEARQQGAAVEVDDARRWAAQRQDGGAVADRRDVAAADGERLDLGRRAGDGEDGTALEDRVGVLARRL